ncbi:MAG: aminomethyl-transferring glycine dehydrogenase subunit GcvPA [Candidatus Omnitrophota bacterium]|nr:aminomethyl-transferring glycine dehydrogenase subunit GcvPA [Candidatus Omnitrophota bacterium]
MPYILNTPDDVTLMLAAIGAGSLHELYAHLPEKIVLQEKLAIGPGLSEYEVKQKLEALAGQNISFKQCNSFLGAGCYDHYIPAALSTIISRAEFLTAYTPYQAENSQGILQAIYEYQSYMCLLTGMDVSNASLFDGASGLAEAVLMALRITGKRKVVVAGSVHPEYRTTLVTYLSGFDFTIEEVGFTETGLLDLCALQHACDDTTACCVFGSPNFFGIIEPGEAIAGIAQEKKALSVLVTNPLSCVILKSPSKLGVDIVCGDGQVLGGAMNFGGPSFGFLATKREFLRQMPGRIVGKTIDKAGNPAYCLTLQAREQHIRRQHATSNICSNQSLNAIAAALYMAFMGNEGLERVATYSLNLAHYLHERIREVRGVEIVFTAPFFNEFVWKIPAAKKLCACLREHNIIAGFCMEEAYPSLRDCIVSCCTEKKTKKDIDSFIEALEHAM